MPEAQVVWKGSAAQAQYLTEILQRYCSCDFDNGHKFLCPGHTALVHDQRFADGLLFGQAIRQRLIDQEWSEPVSKKPSQRR